jgi:hypothetical protein
MIGNYRLDWAQSQGQRNTSMVNYYRENWVMVSGSAGRGDNPNLLRLTVFLKVKVRPVPQADLNSKRVGVVYRMPYVPADITALGYYFTTLADGYEEWHVPVHLTTSTPGPLAFTAWYQDGHGNTFFDDFSGELHPALGVDDSRFVDQVAATTTIALDSTGVHGQITVRLADLSFVKDVAMVATTDNWATVLTFGSDQSGATNRWHWIRDLDADYETWGIDVQIPGNVQRFQYAIAYRHGIQVTNRPYEIWASRRGANYVVDRT